MTGSILPASIPLLANIGVTSTCQQREDQTKSKRREVAVIAVLAEVRNVGWCPVHRQEKRGLLLYSCSGMEKDILVYID